MISQVMLVHFTTVCFVILGVAVSGEGDITGVKFHELLLLVGIIVLS